MLLIIGIVLIVAWFIGLIAHIAGGFINLLLIVALIMVISHFLKGRSAKQ